MKSTITLIYNNKLVPIESFFAFIRLIYRKNINSIKSLDLVNFGGYQMRKNWKYILTCCLLFIVLTASSFTIGDTRIMKTSNKQINLGYAYIWGDGNTSILEAVAGNDILIKTDSTTEIVDFFIEYDMDCEGLVDDGSIWFTLTLGGENISANFTQTLFSKNGSLYLHDVEITRGQSLGFVIKVIYGNAYPFFYNETSATGVAIVSKNLLLSYFLTKHVPFLSRLLQFENITSKQ